MKSPLIVACIIASSTWSVAFADQTKLPNPKTSPKHAQRAPSKDVAHSGAVLQTPAQAKAALQEQIEEQTLALKRAAQRHAANPNPLVQGGGAQQGNPQILQGTSALNGSDSCTTPDAISGNGTFTFDTTAATTGSEGQTESLCLAYGYTTIDSDVWFSWTAPVSGTAIFSLCSMGFFDSKIAAYPGSGCPVTGTALACNDDFCSLNSQVAFVVTGGSTYTLQLGSFPGNPGTSGSFTMNVLTSGPPNDDCSTPTVISGSGPFAYDNTLGTTGPQQGLSCGLGNCELDLWYEWTAPSSGIAVMDLCGGGSGDSILAAYAGAGCPTPGTAIACNDDFCGLTSHMNFPCTSGTTYELQLGSWTATPIPAGSFTMNVFLPPANDDCSTPTVISGSGPFAFDNTLASTGPQQGLACGTGVCACDLWYDWTAPSSGTAIFSMCGGATNDALIAVYAGSGCPSPGTALTCNDDGCYGGGPSVCAFACTAGSHYMLQLGSWLDPYVGSGTFTVNVYVPPANDDCSGATAIAGTGTFPFDTTAATTGVQLPSCTNMAGDVWYDWTCTFTGSAAVSTCAGSSFDTVAAVYNGSGCPGGAEISCDDNGCGLQSQALFNCTAGSHYMIQIGGAFGAFGAGTFDLIQVVIPPEDDCNTPATISGVGTFPYDNTWASTGVDGQNEPLCAAQYGQFDMQHDVWFTWVSPSTGRANVGTCGLTGNDTKMAAYAGSGCPVAGTALACNDDACAFQSQLCFDVTAGSTYTIQIATFPGSPGGAGFFGISVGAPLPLCTWDDGTTENLLTWTVGGDMAWLNAFGTAGQTTVVSSVSAAWGSVLFPNYNPGNGTPTDIFVWQDGATQDNDPTDAILLLQIPTTVSLVDTDTYVTYPITPISITGTFFVGSHQDNYGLSGAGPTQFVAPMDQNCPTPGVAWFFGNNSGFGTSPVDYTNLANNVQPPLKFESIGLPCQVLIRAGCNTGPASYLCDPGSGPTIACPCGNPPAGSGRGCDNSSFTGGASITGSGSNSLSSPTLVFTTGGEKPSATSILLQGDAVNTAGIVFGQGVRCATGILKRLYVKTASGGSITAPAGGDMDIPARSAFLGDPISGGQLRSYMVYYRDPTVLGGCSAFATFNATNTASVTWQP